MTEVLSLEMHVEYLTPIKFLRDIINDPSYHDNNLQYMESKYTYFPDQETISSAVVGRG
jgi:hypothetical protein